MTALGRRNGLTRGAELQQGALERVGVASNLVEVDHSPRRLTRHVDHTPAATYVFHAAASEMPLLVNGVLPECGRARRIGYWAWELPDPPLEWKRFERLVSEVWALSTFAAGSAERRLSVPVDAASVVDAAAELPKLAVVLNRLDDEQMASLFRSADVLLSLHRSEGFGLPMLEAMAHGVPVVGTGWSGNRDLMTEANSCLVPYALVPVRDKDGVYRGTASHWADPDVDAAAEMLRHLASDTDAHAALARLAHASVAELPSEWTVEGSAGVAADREPPRDGT